MSSSPPTFVEILPLQTLKPELDERAWVSRPHPTLPLIATAHAKSVIVYSLSTLSFHSSLTGGHERSVRDVAWKPGLSSRDLCLVSGSFDATTGLWRWVGDAVGDPVEKLEKDISHADAGGSDDEQDSHDQDWEFVLVIDGQDKEIKSCAFSPSGEFLAVSSRNKAIWIWEDVGATEGDDDWAAVASLEEHAADVKAVAWCPDVPGRNRAGRNNYGVDVFASASYDNTIRIWRQDLDAEWRCVAVLEGHEGTVWGLQWEAKPERNLFPRLLSCSTDQAIRVWTLKQEEDEAEDADNAQDTSRTVNGIPNTMRRSLREDWTCTAVLPKVHEGDIYSVAWSADTGLVASTGADGVIALYREDLGAIDGNAPAWNLLKTVSNAHGPYEVNHITWCRRYDSKSTRKGEEEMLVTSGDDGVVQAWEVKHT